MKNQLKIKKVYNKGITLIALVITIIVLLILAGVSIATLAGENGILTQANMANTQMSHATVKEGILLEYGNYKIELESPKNGETNESFLEFLSEKEIIDENGIIDTKKLGGEKLKLGNGSDTKDVYKIEQNETNYILSYYDEEGEEIELEEIKESFNKETGTITFSIGGESYTAEAGMTWEEWINSTTYTSDDWEVAENGNIVRAENDACTEMTEKPCEFVKNGNTKMDGENEIIANTNYLISIRFYYTGESYELKGPFEVEKGTTWRQFCESGVDDKLEINHWENVTISYNIFLEKYETDPCSIEWEIGGGECESLSGSDIIEPLHYGRGEMLPM